MDLFHIITGATAILRSKSGTFRQVNVYRRKDRLYVGNGNSFVRIETPAAAGSWNTSAPSTIVEAIDMGEDNSLRISTDSLSRLIVSEYPRAAA